MRPDQTKAHWDAAYETRPPERQSWYQPAPSTSLGLIQATGLQAQEPLIDVGAGASSLVGSLLNHGFRDVTVLDVSSTALDVSRENLGPLAQRVTWLCEDVRSFQSDRSYALWHDRALFHFLTDAEDRKRYMRALRAGLKKGGYFIVATFAVGGPTRCSGLDIVQYDDRKMLATLGPGFELERSLREPHRTPAGGQQLFSWFVLRRT